MLLQSAQDEQWPSSMSLYSQMSPNSKHRLHKQITQLQHKLESMQQQLQLLQSKPYDSKWTVALSNQERKLAQVQNQQAQALQEYSAAQRGTTVIEESRFEVVFQIQDKQLQMEALRQECVECFRHRPTPLQAIRMQLIEIQTSPVMTQIEGIFSLRKMCLEFMKGKVKPQDDELEYGMELQIAKRGQSQHYKWFVLGSAKQKGVDSFENGVMESIQEYVELIVRAEGLMKEVKVEEQHQRKTDLERQVQLTKLAYCKEEVTELELELEDNSERLRKAKLKEQHKQSLVAKKTKEAEGAMHELTSLQKKRDEQESIQQQKTALKEEIRELIEAIEYLLKRQIRSQNHISSVNLLPPCSTQSLPPVHSMTSLPPPHTPAPKTQVFQDFKTPSRIKSGLKTRKKTTIPKSPKGWK